MTEDELILEETEDAGSAEVIEVVAEVVEDYTFMDKPFEEYTTTEGLLLVIAVFVFLDFILNILRRWF